MTGIFYDRIRMKKYIDPFTGSERKWAKKQPL